MKKTCLFLAILSVVSLASCTKEDNIPDEDTPGEETKPYVPPITITSVTTYTPDEFITKLSGSTYASWIGLEDYLQPILETFTETREPEIRALFLKETGNLSLDNWEVNQVNFDYYTVDVKGDSTVMSGVMCYVDNNTGATGHSLSSISLVCHTFYNNNTDCPTFKGDITMGRALWNSLVVLPDMQGYGSSKLSGDGMKLSNSCVNQVVDCERAAIKIAKSLGLTFDDDYYTNVMGYSLGGGVMMAVARWMESCSMSDQNLFKYNHAFVGGGMFNYWDYLSDYVRNKINLGTYVSSISMPTITYLVKPSDLGGYKTEDFWTEPYTAVLDTIENHPVSPATFTFWRYDANEVNTQHKEKLKAFFGTDEAKHIFPDDMSTDTLILDPSTPKTKILKALCDREIPYTGWAPTHTITIFHPENDEQMPFFMAKNAYDALVLNGGGSNVQLKAVTIPTPSSISVSPHYVGTALAQLKMLCFEDPSSIYDTEFLEEIINAIGNQL